MLLISTDWSITYYLSFNWYRKILIWWSVFWYRLLLIAPPPLTPARIHIRPGLVAKILWWGRTILLIVNCNRWQWWEKACISPVTGSSVYSSKHSCVSAIKPPYLRWTKWDKYIEMLLWQVTSRPVKLTTKYLFPILFPVGITLGMLPPWPCFPTFRSFPSAFLENPVPELSHYKQWA